MRNRLDGRQGVNERIMLRELLRRVDMMVLYDNRLDGFVRLHSPWVPGKFGHANQPRGGCTTSRSSSSTGQTRR
ncbi:hypothetical protein [Histidinibacterium lentulum]|uniref:Uncharacterized protein n=1 Tax=Histidinibacterium lentulum TaxID=2480588 RepID=A0A3N2QW93_9RHOB|nr:hypothetical protein [Histidinibacterium lentulum]ROT99504.1 hypothetical protein EAT49_14965 [Histidinibacterium lentulum]